MNVLKTALAAGLGLALLGSGAAQAATTIQFDPDGVGGTNGILTVGTFDWNVNSTLGLGAVPAATGGEFQVYAQASMSVLNDGDGNTTGDLSGFELTFVGGFGERYTLGGGGLAIFEPASDPTAWDNFFRIYYDDTPDSDPLAGTGYNDGLLILEGIVGDISGVFLGDPDVTLLDLFGGDDWGGQLSVGGQGSTALEAAVTFAHPDFFYSNFSGFLVDLFFNTTNNLPFLQTDPSRCFTKADNTAICEPDGDWNLGEINGVDGPDILFQTDANQSFQVARIPEPAPLALLSLGLMLLGAQRLASRRRRDAGEDSA